MLYHNSRELLQLLEKEGLRARHSLGQNFLVNPGIVDKIIAAGKIEKNDHLLEIGPGLGMLTGKLLDVSDHVTAVEKDLRLFQILQKNFAGRTNLQLINADILKTSLPPAPYKVIANIPYYITSPILTCFLNAPAEQRPSIMILMTQLEVARKIQSGPGEHSMLSLQTQLFARTNLIHRVSAGNFFPPPKVDSAIIRLDLLDKPRIDDSKTFLRLISIAFGQKRKTLVNSLARYPGLDKETAREILIAAGLDPAIRPQQLDFPDWAQLIERLTGSPAPV
jgi:16S rRNA (adenine1518-N6/adenine1519-N6)-dimethyltransferase